jgi:hypothetical protein
MDEMMTAPLLCDIGYGQALQTISPMPKTVSNCGVTPLHPAGKIGFGSRWLPMDTVAI